MLGRLSLLTKEVEEAYETLQFNRASAALQRFAVSDLSNFYLDVAKDRLYISASNDHRRRSCQTVMKVVLETIAVLMAPLLPHMAEDIWQNLPYDKTSKTVFEQGWVEAGKYPEYDPELWSTVLKLRNDVNKCIESARRESLIGKSITHLGETL